MKVLIADDDRSRLMLKSALRVSATKSWPRIGRNRLAGTPPPPVRVVVSDWMIRPRDSNSAADPHGGGEYVTSSCSPASLLAKNQLTAANAGVDDFLSKHQSQEMWRRLRVATRILDFTKQVPS